MHLVFGAIAILLSVFIVKARAVYPVSIGVVLATYFLDILSKLSKDADWLKYLTPFKYIDAADIVTDVRIATLSLLVMGGVVLFCLAVSLVLYHRKDIAA
jgi:ABC-2 type transport system permease protein